MEKRISTSTITTCIAMLQNRVEQMNARIDSYPNPVDVPSWMYEGVSDLGKCIDELKDYIGI